MQSPLVSILIPVYNRETLIGECIQSALDQTFVDLEVVIVDNASTDKTWEICQQYANKDKRVKIFRNETNVGPVRNWLRCVSEARGEFGKILFSDDLIFPKFLEHTLPYFEDPAVAFVTTAVMIGETPAKGVVTFAHFDGGPRLSSKHYFDLLIKVSVPYSPGAGIFRMSDMSENLLSSISTKSYRDFTKNGAGPDVLLYALTSLKYKYVVMLSSHDAFFREHADSFSMLNSENEVVKGYRAAMAWFCRKKLTTRHWATYIARAWLLDMQMAHKLLSMRKYCIAYEGNGHFLEIMEVSWCALRELVMFVLKRLIKQIQFNK